MRFTGLGIYPNCAIDSDCQCFDPGRPAWMPFWMDTWDESACKYGFYGGTMKTPPNPVVPPLKAPQTQDAMTDGSWTPKDAAPTNKDWIDANMRNLRDYNPGPDDPSDEDKTRQALIYSALVLGAIVILGVTTK